jgi:LysM repeat protein
MNTPNPLIPQGSLQQHAAGKSNVRTAVFIILALHGVLLSGLLVQGCNKDKNTAGSGKTNTYESASLPPLTNTDLTSMNSPTGSAASAVTATPLVISTNLPPTTPVTPMVTETPAAATSSGKEYVVAKGDTLATIAKKNGVSLKALQAANPTVVPTKLKIGQKLQLPAGASAAAVSAPSGAATPTPAAASGDTKMYTVKSGDTLTKIAKANGTTLAALRKLNELKNDTIKIGQKIKLPVKGAATTEAASTTSGTPVTSTPLVTPLPPLTNSATPR